MLVFEGRFYFSRRTRMKIPTWKISPAGVGMFAFAIF